VPDASGAVAGCIGGAGKLCGGGRGADEGGIVNGLFGPGRGPGVMPVIPVIGPIGGAPDPIGAIPRPGG
jgi:hypothetical protein